MKANAEGRLRWDVLVLDDVPNGQLSLKNLKRLWGGFANVTIEGGDFDGLADGLLRTLDADIILVDMDWKVVGLPRDGSPNGDGEFPVLDQALLHQSARQDPMKSKSLRSFIRDWLATVSDAVNTPQKWLEEHKQSIDGVSGVGPGRIPCNEVGIWIGALVSHLFPKAQIFLFTQHLGDLNVRREIREWLIYRNPPIRLLNKEAEKGLPLCDMVPTFNEMQRKVLLKHKPLQLWAQNSVWLPLLLGEEPRVLESVSYKSQFQSLAESVTIVPDEFFVQLRSEASVDRSEFMRQLFESAFDETSHSNYDTATFHAMFHILQEEAESDLEQRKSELEGLLLSLSRGEYIPHCCKLLQEGNWDKFAREIYTASIDATPALLEELKQPVVGNTDSGYPDRKLMRTIFKTNGPQVFRSDPKVMREAITHLRTNHGSLKSMIRSYSANQVNAGLELEFALKLKKDGFHCVHSFRKSLQDSMSNGGHQRGYPRILIWAIQSGAKHIGVKFDNSLHTIFDETQLGRDLSEIPNNFQLVLDDDDYGLLIRF